MGFSKFPLFNDVCTDLQDVITFVKADVPPMDERVVKLNEKTYPDLTGLQVAASPEEVFEKVLAIAKRQKGWTISYESKEDGYIEGVSATALLRFKDDFAIRMRSTDSGTVIDMRSKSRVGKSDWGKNHARITALFKEIAKEF